MAGIDLRGDNESMFPEEAVRAARMSPSEWRARHRGHRQVEQHKAHSFLGMAVRAVRCIECDSFLTIHLSLVRGNRPKCSE